jgi:hypothetical protein
VNTAPVAQFSAAVALGFMLCSVMLSIIMLHFIKLSVIMLSFMMLSVVMLSFFEQSVVILHFIKHSLIMLSVITEVLVCFRQNDTVPSFVKQSVVMASVCYAECHYAKCCGAFVKVQKYLQFFFRKLLSSFTVSETFFICLDG